MFSSESDHKAHPESSQQIPGSNDEISKELIDPLTHSKTLEESEQSNMPISEDQEDDEEEEGECGFCLFMKGGGCKDSFVAWEECIKEADINNEDIVGKCFEITSTLKLCMEAHNNYYAPILSAEKAAEEEARNEIAKEKEKEAAGEEIESESNEKGKEAAGEEIESESNEKGNEAAGEEIESESNEKGKEE